MFSNTLAVAFAALLAQSAFAADCTRKYTVKEGDICDSISAANQVSTYQLAVVNQGHIDSTCSNLIPGDEVCLGNAGEDCTTTYTVKDNDTCDGINSATGLNSTILYLNNPQINEACDNIYIGEVLCIAQTVQVPVAPSGGIPATTIPATATPAVPSAVKTPAAAVSSSPAAPPPPPPEAPPKPAAASSSQPVPEVTEPPVVVSSSAVPATTTKAAATAPPAPHNLAPAPTSAPAPEPAKNSNVDDSSDDGDDDENCDGDDDGDDGSSADNAGDSDNGGDDDDNTDDADDADLPFCDEMDDN